MAIVSKILVPVEFSPRCEGAARYAAALAGRFQAQITLIHVVVPMVVYGSPEAMAYSAAEDVTGERLDLAKAHLADFLAPEVEHLTVDRVVQEGDPATVIVEFAQQRKCDLIVMPTHGYGPFRRFLLGSVTAKVLHDAGCPVWTGPHLEQAPISEAIQFRKVVCAVDLTDASARVIQWADCFARQFGAALAVAHAIPKSTIEVGGMYFDPDWGTQMMAVAKQRLEALLEKANVRAEILVEAGETALAISDAAERAAADLLVIGRGHPSGVLGRLRTHAYAIVREAPCPVAAI